RQHERSIRIVDGKKCSPDRCGVITEDDKVVHLQEVAGRDANHVFDFGASLGTRRLALGFHITSANWAMTIGGEASNLRKLSFLPITKGGGRDVSACRRKSAVGM